ncbi:MAG TPA: methionine--tRNA ligase [bacterium]|nr:methionine--tRNA ligase [bacterium]
MKRILVTSALPYANGPIHLGHLAGAYLPADVYVRYQRMKKRDVLYICGTDEHGVPIAIAAEKQSITPQQLVDRYYADHLDTFTRFGMSFDNFSRTSRPLHHKTSQAFFQNLYNKNVLVERTVQQFYCDTCRRFLADRFVEGICPRCQQPGARGDQCEKCGSSLEQTELIKPYCKVCGHPPVLKDTRHLFFKLGDFQSRLETWLAEKKNWKENVLNYCRGWFKEGLGERAVTRDLKWGIPAPAAGYEDKMIYVWFEAPIGYISATKEWAERIGQPDKWKEYWMDSRTKLVHFIGKDNIVFHAIIWPAMIMAHGDLILPADIPANEFLNLQGEKLSTSRNYAVWLGEYLDKFPPDPLRYYLAAIAPESKDADFTWTEFQQRNNSELADILGNFINRTLTFAKRQFNGVPAAGELNDLDRAMIRVLEKAPVEIGDLFERYELRRGLTALMDVARFANKYFNDQQPWATLKTDRSRCATTINLCLHAVQTLAILMEPVLPFSAEKTWAMLGHTGSVHQQSWDEAGSLTLKPGHRLGQEQILFNKIEDKQIQPEIDRLAAASKNQPPTVAAAETPAEPAKISYDDFSRVQLRLALVLKAEKVEKADKLLRLEIQVGDEKRQIVAGIAKHYAPEQLIGKTIVVVANLQPAKIRGLESNGMLLAAEDETGQLAVLTPDRPVQCGAKVK